MTADPSGTHIYLYRAGQNAAFPGEGGNQVFAYNLSSTGVLTDSSADKMMRTPLSKQRNKHIQHVLIEAAKLAPRQSYELALVHEKEMQKGNRNRATLAVARKMVVYLLAVDRQQRDFVPAEERRAGAA